MSKTVLEGHGGQIWSVSFCRESKIVAAGSEDHTIHLVDPITRGTIDTLEGHKAGVKAVAFAPRGRFLASGAKDRLVTMWDPTRRVEFVLEGHRGPINSLAFSGDSRFLASGGVSPTRQARSFYGTWPRRPPWPGWRDTPPKCCRWPSLRTG